MFDSSLTYAAGSPPLDSAIDRRLWVRHPCKFEISCEPVAVETDMVWSAMVRDISAGGIGLALGRPFEPGTALFIELPTPLGGQLRTLPVRVAHATAGDNGFWLVGCEFLSPLREEDLHAFLQQLDAEEQADRPD
jgi:hypothetical protein